MKLLRIVLLLCAAFQPAIARAELPDTGKRLHRVDLEHFTLWSQRELSASGLTQTRQNLQNVRREIGRAFGGFFPSQKFDVVLTEEKVFRDYSKSPAHVSGLFDGTIHLPVSARGADARLKAILHHEYTHALLWLASQGHCPVWIQEGFAVDQEERIVPLRSRDLGAILEGGALAVPLTELDARMQVKTGDPIEVDRAYRVAFAVIRYLRSEYSAAQLLKWIRRIGPAGSWEAAAREVLGLDARELEERTVGFVAKTAPQKDPKGRLSP